MTKALHVLVVDDEEYIRELLCRRIKDLGHHCDAAHNGERALEMLKTNAYQVVLADLIMPELDGESLLRHLKQELQHPVDVVMVSSQDDERAIQELLDLGATAYITKPLNEDTLKNVMSQLVARHS